MISRRRFSLALGSLALTGCCTRRYPTAPQILDAGEMLSASAFLASGQQMLDQNNATFELIDAHAHFINASDVPVKDYLGQSIAHTQKSPVRELLELLAPLATLIAENAPTAKQEFDDLADFERSMRLNNKVSQPQLLKREWADRVVKETRSTAERVVKVTRNSAFLKRYMAIKREAVRSVKRTGKSSSQLDVEEVINVVEANQVTDNKIQSAISTPDNGKAREADGVLGFLFYLLSPRSNNIDAHRRAYSDNTKTVRARLALGALVDFDYWQGCAPSSSHEDQIKLHRVLSRSSRGYMKPLLAYNPWTDIELDGEGLERVKRAMKTNDFAGVKIYPPSGFSPGENAWFKTTKPRPNAAELDFRLDAFFDYCAQESVVVMAHTNHSAGRDDDHDNLSGPKEWRKRFNKHNDPKKPLMVNLSHYGGESHDNWTSDFAQLMADFPHHKIYADIGFWDSLIRCDEGCTKSRQRLLNSLNTVIEKTGESVGDRVMYGTDWLMLSVIPGWPGYQLQIHDWLSRELGEDATQKIFFDNASRFYGSRLS